MTTTDQIRCSEDNDERNLIMGDPPTPTGAGPERSGEPTPHESERRHESVRPDPPRVYIADLAAYNEGALHGAWIDADQPPDDLQNDIDAMLERSPTGHGEEWAVHDTIGFGPYTVGEYESLDWLWRVAAGIVEHGPAFGAWAEQCDGDEDLLVQFEDVYLGEWETVTAYADELLADLGYHDQTSRAVPDWLAPYVHVDVDAFARDLQLGGDITAIEHAGGVWIFDPTP